MQNKQPIDPRAQIYVPVRRQTVPGVQVVANLVNESPVHSPRRVLSGPLFRLKTCSVELSFLKR